MAEPAFDDHTQQFRGGPAPATGFGPDHLGPRTNPHGAGPLGDWLHEAGAAWAAAPGYASQPYAAHAPQPYAAHASQPYAAPAPPPSPWVTPPHLDADEPRARWSLSAAAPWVVAGLLCAVLLTGRGAPATPAALPVEVTATDQAAPGHAGPPEAAGAPVAATTSCAGVSS